MVATKTRLIIWPEILLIVSLAALIVQLFPGLAQTLISATDFRQWSRGMWICVNVLILALLVAARFGGSWMEMIRKFSDGRSRKNRQRTDKSKNKDFQAFAEHCRGQIPTRKSRRM